MTLLKSTFSVRFLSMLRMRNDDSRVSDIVEHRAVFTNFNLEKERAVDAVVTGTVRQSL